MEDKFLLYPAEGDIDEDEGMTLREIMEMLAERFNCEIVEKEPF